GCPPPARLLVGGVGCRTPPCRRGPGGEPDRPAGDLVARSPRRRPRRRLAGCVVARIAFARDALMAGRIRQADVEEVKARTNIADIIGERVALKNAGVGAMKGLCPFHDERSPSFNVRPQAGFY